MIREGILKFSRFNFGSLLTKLSVLAFVLMVCGAASKAYAGITVTPVTWNVVGLDSNNTSTGPDTFQIGARVRNTGATAITNVTGNFIWDSTNAYVNLSGPSTINVGTLAAGASLDIYFSVVITRTSAAYDTKRQYHINVSADNTAAVSTPTGREVYVEHIISQNRNSVQSITGPTTVYVGQTYNYTVNASTATGGYEQLEAFLNLSNIIFQVTNINTTYTAPTGGTNDKFYADACGWDNNPLSATYRSCIGPVQYAGGKAGGNISTTYTVKVLSTGTTTASTLILDFSGSSYHYNSDYGQGINSITITAIPPPVPSINLQKSVSPSLASQIIPGANLTYTIAFSNVGTASATSLIVTDPIPANTDFKVGSATSSLGTTGLTVSVSYSSNGGSTWTYTPVSGGGSAPAGYDRNVTNVRWVFSNSLSQTPPNNAGSVSFIVRIR